MEEVEEETGKEEVMVEVEVEVEGKEEEERNAGSTELV